MTEAHAQPERRTRWSFSYTADNTWYWRAVRADGTEERSQARLESLADCLADALEHGFVSWTTAAERRRDGSRELIE
jgi:hypothetical protein